MPGPVSLMVVNFDQRSEYLTFRKAAAWKDKPALKRPVCYA